MVLRVPLLIGDFHLCISVLSFEYFEMISEIISEMMSEIISEIISEIQILYCLKIVLHILRIKMEAL